MTLETLNRKLRKYWANKLCKIDDIVDCKYERCRCRVLAEVQAYMKTIIPEKYQNYNIDDFTGINEKRKRVVEEDKVLGVKNCISNYCWGKDFFEIKKIIEEHKKELKVNKKAANPLDKISFISYRKKNGNNIVISGKGGKGIGKTLIASVIMKEVIKRRAFKDNASDSYKWVNFPVLFEMLKNNSEELTLYKNPTWLVVDNITKDYRFAAQYIDSFFFKRIEMNYPTLLVFRFPLSDSPVNVEEYFGSAINSIIESSKTFNIEV